MSGGVEFVQKGFNTSESTSEIQLEDGNSRSSSRDPVKGDSLPKLVLPLQSEHQTEEADATLRNDIKGERLTNLEDLFNDVDQIDDINELRNSLHQARFWLTYYSGVATAATEEAAHIERSCAVQNEARIDLEQRLTEAEIISARAMSEADRLKSLVKEMSSERDELIGRKFYLEQLLAHSKKGEDQKTAATDGDEQAMLQSHANFNEYKIKQLEQIKESLEADLDRVSSSLAETKSLLAIEIEGKAILKRLILHYTRHIEKCAPHLIVDLADAQALNLIREEEVDYSVASSPAGSQSQFQTAGKRSGVLPLLHKTNIWKIKNYIAHVGGTAKSNKGSKARRSGKGNSINKLETTSLAPVDHKASKGLFSQSRYAHLLPRLSSSNSRSYSPASTTVFSPVETSDHMANTPSDGRKQKGAGDPTTSKTAAAHGNEPPNAKTEGSLSPATLSKEKQVKAAEQIIDGAQDIAEPLADKNESLQIATSNTDDNVSSCGTSPKPSS